MPEMRMNSLKSRAMNCGPLSEMIRGFATGYFSLARSRISSTSASRIDSRKSQCTRKRLNPSRMLQQAIERAAQVDVGNVDMPVMVRLVLQVEADDPFLFPRLQPEITGNPTVVL